MFSAICIDNLIDGKIQRSACHNTTITDGDIFHRLNMFRLALMRAIVINNGEQI